MVKTIEKYLNMRALYAVVKTNIIFILLLFASSMMAQVCPTSNSVTISVVADPTISISAATTICNGGTANLSSTTSGGTGTCTIQWFQSPDNASWTSISGANGATYTTATLTTSTYYRATYSCTGTGCDPGTSNSILVTVVADPAISSHPNNIDECVGGTNPLSVAISGGTGTISYQWQSSTAIGGPFANISGATSSTYTPPSATAGTLYYQVIISATGNGCGSTTSNVATVIVRADLSISSQPTNIDECVGGTNGLSVTVTGGSGTVSYQWQSSTAVGGPFANISGATSSTYTPPSATAGTLYYQVIISATGSDCGSTTSNVATVIVRPDLSISSQPTNIDECVGGTNALSVTVTGGSGTVSLPMAIIYCCWRAICQYKWSNKQHLYTTISHSWNALLPSNYQCNW